MNEYPIDLKERFTKRMHGMITHYANISGRPKKYVKENLKIVLKSKGLIQNSTKELGIKGLAIACNIIEEKINGYRN